MASVIFPAILSVFFGSVVHGSPHEGAGEQPQNFYLVQIEQVIGGIGGDTSAQAVQLRLRANGILDLEWAKILAWDSAGENPITLIEFDESADTQIQNHLVGYRILIASPNLANHTGTRLSPDFTLANLIPESYLTAGRITYEDDFGTTHWSLSFGGDAYTGPTTGSGYNDDDGDFGPAYDGPLPSDGVQALLFQGDYDDLHTTNQDDYLITAGPAVFTNNSGASDEVIMNPTAIPTLSEWGVAGLTLLLLVTGTLLIRRQQAHSP